MYKFIISLQLQPGARDQILVRAPEVQAATRAEPGCIANDFYTCSDDPDRLVFRILEIEGGPRMALEQNHTKGFHRLPRAEAPVLQFRDHKRRAMT